MLKIEEFNSEGIKYVESKDFEIVNCTSERNCTHEYKSLTYEFGFDLSNKIREKLSLKFKDAKYKLLVCSNEIYDKTKDLYSILLLESKEQIQYLSSFNEFKKINFEYLKESPKDIEMTFFKQNVKMWCDEFHRYITNNFNFKGITKVLAVGINGNLLNISITPSGKGTTDEIVKLSKYVEKMVILENITPDKIYTIIDNYFKS